MNYNIKNLNLEDHLDILRIFTHTYSQLNQEAFVALFTGFRKNGIFIEFGAFDGIEYSNTYCLEHNLGWKGILIEPNKSCYHYLQNNRNCIIDNRCIYSESNKILTFREIQSNQEFSGIDLHLQPLPTNEDLYSNSTTYTVKTISLLDLLNEYNVPNIIDYLSIDTEGSEFEILSSFDFSKYKFRVITVEHNNRPYRKDIKNLLEKNNYLQVLSEVSQIDDWYINLDLYKNNLATQE